MWHTTGLDGTAGLALDAGPVLVAAAPEDTAAIEALLVQATLNSRHRSVRAARVMNGWAISAVDE